MADEASKQAQAINHVSVRRVLKLKGFRRLWLSQLFSQTAGHLINFVLVLRMYELTGSGFLVSLLVVVLALPTILFSSLAGVYADTFNRKYLLIASTLVRSLLVVGLSFFPASPGLFLLFGFLLSSAMQFFGPAQSAAIPKLVRAEELFAANSLFMFTMYASVLGGYLLAGPALTFLGDLRTASLLVVAFTLSAIFGLQLPGFRDHLERQYGRSYLDRAFGNLANDLRHGLELLQKNRLLQILVVFVSILFAVERTFIGLLPNLAKNIFSFSVDEMSYFLVAPAGVATVLAAAWGNRLIRRMTTYRLLLTSFFFVGASLVLLPLAPLVDHLTHGSIDLILFAAALAALCGAGSMFVLVAGQMLLHELTPAEAHGRMFGSIMTIMNAVALPLILVIGGLADVVSLSLLLVVLGGGLCVVGLGVSTLSRREASQPS